MTDLESGPNKHVHRQEDYSALDGKELSPDMLDSILTTAENGLPLTREQSIALGRNPDWELTLLPKAGVRSTEAQIDAFFGGKEERIKKARWFTAETLPHSIKTMEKAIAEGKRWQKGSYGSRVRLHLLLAWAKKELHLLTTTTMPLSDIQKLVIETVHVRPIYLLPRLGEATIAMPYLLYPVRTCTIRQKDRLAVYFRTNNRWQRLDGDKFEYVPPVPEWKQPKQPKQRKQKTETAPTEKKPRKRKSATVQYRLAFHKRVYISYRVRVRLGEQPDSTVNIARQIVNAEVGKHRATIRERLKAGEIPQNKTLVTLHPLDGLPESTTLLLASNIEKSEWRSPTDVTLWFKTMAAFEENYEGILEAVDELSADWGKPPEQRV